MNEIELLEVLHLKTVTDTRSGERHFQSVPITQAVTRKQKLRLEGKARVAIKCPQISDQILAVLEHPSFYPNRKEEIAARTFGTQSGYHTKVEQIMAQGDFLMSSSKIRYLRHVAFNDGMDKYRLSPE